MSQEDDLRSALAYTAAVLTGDEEGQRVLLEHADRRGVAVFLTALVELFATGRLPAEPTRTRSPPGCGRCCATRTAGHPDPPPQLEVEGYPLR